MIKRLKKGLTTNLMEDKEINFEVLPFKMTLEKKLNNKNR